MKITVEQGEIPLGTLAEQAELSLRQVLTELRDAYEPVLIPSRVYEAVVEERARSCPAAI